jgi:hypothetical protein
MEVGMQEIEDVIVVGVGLLSVRLVRSFLSELVCQLMDGVEPHHVVFVRHVRIMLSEHLNRTCNITTLMGSASQCSAPSFGSEDGTLRLVSTTRSLHGCVPCGGVRVVPGFFPASLKSVSSGVALQNEAPIYEILVDQSVAIEGH